uniref:Uncharacterized protein n=1 Tax=Rhizophora mucronata TaxID=61149 RepID=A0A2P2NCX6_RHIMU
MMMQPCVGLAESSLNLGTSLRVHSGFNEDKTSHQKQQLTVQTLIVNSKCS